MSDFLTIYGMAVPVAAPSPPDAEYQERGGEVVPAFAGNLLSSVKGHARVWRVQTPALSESDARYYEAVLRAPYAVPCDGRLTGGPVLAFVRGLRLRPVARSGGARWAVEFELHEATTRAPDGNLIRNPGFEEGGAYWSGATGQRAYLSDPAQAHSGSGYARLTVPSGQDAIAITEDPAGGGATRFVPVAPGDVVNFGAMIYRESGTGLCRPRLWPYDTAKVSVAPAQINGPEASTTGAWQHRGASYTVPAGVAYVRFDLQVLNGPTVARFDGAYLRIRKVGA